MKEIGTPTDPSTLPTFTDVNVGIAQDVGASKRTFAIQRFGGQARTLDRRCSNLGRARCQDFGPDTH